jgi:phage shock protein E
MSLVLVVLLAAACGAGPATGNTAGGSAASTESLPATVDVAAVNALQSNPDVVILDVREPYEYEAGHIPGVKLIPLGELPSRLAEVPKDRPVIVTCRTGNRSGQATAFLRQQGYTNVHNMSGGFVAWERAGYAVEKQCASC